MEPVGGGATGARTRLRNQMRRLFRLLPFSTASTSRAAGEVKRFMDGDIEEIEQQFLNQIELLVQSRSPLVMEVFPAINAPRSAPFFCSTGRGSDQTECLPLELIGVLLR